MNALQQWSALVGFLLPGVLAIVQQPRFPNWARVLVLIVGSCVAAAVTAQLQGRLDVHRWASSVVLVGTLAAAFYHAAWRPTGAAQAIEHATSPKPHARRTPRKSTTRRRTTHRDAGVTVVGLVILVVVLLLIIAVIAWLVPGR